MVRKLFRKIAMIQRIFLIFCTIFIINGMISGIASAADHNIIIGFHQSNVSTEEKLVHDNGGKLKKTFHLISAVSVNMSDENISKLKKDSRVAYVVNDTIYKAADEYTNSWGVQYIGSKPVHNQSINGSGVKIAVLDTGIDYTHSDLRDNYKGGFDFVNNDSDPWDDNCLSLHMTCHGTHVSGIIAAEDNGFGVVGVAPGASIYAVKVLDGGGFGTASLIVSGIEWAVNSGMNIVSMSLSSPENNTAVFDAVNAAYNSGILLVAAGGNTGGGPVLYPAAYDSVIAVTAIDHNDKTAIFSPQDPKIELAAPGVDISSTVCIAAQAPNTCLTEGYALLSGTSMAAPHVTGAAALIFSTGIKNNKDVRAILQNTARPVGTLGRNSIYGFGVLDASNAVLGIPTYPPIRPFIPTPTPTPTSTPVHIHTPTPADNTPPLITINSPIDGKVYIMNQNLIAKWSASDVSGIANTIGTYPSGNAINTASVGTKGFSVRAKDKAGNTNTTNVTYYIRYNFGGFLPPVNNDGSSIFKLGSKIQIRFRLNDARFNNVASAVARLNFSLITPTVTGKYLQSFSYDTTTTGVLFKYDSKQKWYQYSLDTKGLQSGTLQIRTDINDGGSYVANISLQK